jgi:integrase
MNGKNMIYKTNKMLCQCGNDLNKNKKFRVRVKLASGRWLSQQVDNFSLAKKVEAKFKTQAIEDKVFEVRRAPTLDSVWKQYLSWLKSNRASWKDDLSRWNQHIAPYVGGMKMDKITPTKIDALLDKVRKSKSRRGEPYAPQTIKHILVLLKRTFNWGIKKNVYHGYNPCNRIEVPKFDNQVCNPLTADQLKALLNALADFENERAALVIKFCLFSGKRRQETLKLKWGDVDLINAFMTFRSPNTKNRKTQTLPINEHCMQIFKRAFELKISDYVFPCSTGKFFHSLDATWQRFKRKRDLRYRLHDLRHTYASWLASSGKVTIIQLQHLLGHRSTRMTERYAHLIDDALKKASSVADEVFEI